MATVYARISDDARHGFDRACTYEGVSLAALLEAIGLKMADDVELLGRRGADIVELAKAIDAERRARG